MGRTNRRRFFMGTLALSLGAGRSFAHGPGGLAGDDEIGSLLDTRIGVQGRGTGAAVGVVRSGRLSVVSRGVIRLDHDQPPSSDSIFQIASLTKVFTGLLLADAVVRGELGLDDPLDLHLPVPAPRFEGRSISLRDLATHTSGLPLRPESRTDRSQDDPYAGYGEADLHADLQAVRLTRPPGSAFEYSNLGYGLLGAAISNRLGRSYEELLARRILDPLGMDETRLIPSASMRSRMMQGYDPQFAPMRPWDFGALAPAGGLYSSIRDLGKFVALWTGSDQPLSRIALSMLGVSRPGDDPHTSMAIGWRIVRRNGRTLAWSNGNGGGVRSFIGLSPGDATAVIAFANMATAGGVDDIGLHVLDRSAPVDVALAPLRTPIVVEAGILDQYVGEYVHVPGDALTIERADEGLVLVQGAQRIALFAETPRLFFIREDNITLEFMAPANGRSPAFVLAQGGQTYIYRRPGNR